MTKKVGTILFYNVLVIVILIASIEMATRAISWVSGKGFTLSLHELDPQDQAIKSIYQWHPFTGFTFRNNTAIEGGHPNQNKKALVYTDQYGFLANDTSLTYEKGNDEVRIATIGASTTANLNLNYSENWPGRLGGFLQNDYPDKRFKIINAGTPGFDTAQSISNLALRVMPFKPDIVIIYHAYNDLKAIRKDVEFRPDYSHIHTKPHGFHKEPSVITKMLNKSMLYVRMRNKKRETNKTLHGIQQQLNLADSSKKFSLIPQYAEQSFEQHMRILIHIAKSGGAKVILSTFATLHDPNLDYDDKDDLERLSAFQINNISGLLHFTPGLTLTAIFDGFLKFNDVIRKLAVEESFTLVDNANLIPHEDRYFVDRVHFSEAGAELMARNFYQGIVDVLKTSRLISN